jgi:hypothetical protein
MESLYGDYQMAAYNFCAKQRNKKAMENRFKGGFSLGPKTPKCVK